MPESAFERLPCKLTVAEKNMKSDELALEVRRHGELEVAKASAAKSYADKLKQSDRKITDLATEVREGVEYREVPVARRKILGERNVIETWRMDTGEVVHTRALEPHERQTEMFNSAEAKAHAELSELYSSGPKDEDGDEDEDESAVEH